MALNYNQTNVTNFYLDIPDSNVTRAFRSNIQTALIPGIHIPPTSVPSGPKGLGRAMLPGSTVEFDPLVCRFLLDENLSGWLDIYKWMISLNNYMTEYNNGWENGVLPKFITLHVLDNTKKNIVLSYHYYGAWPSDISEVEYSHIEDTDPAISCVVTFQYKYFMVEKDGVIIDTRESIAQSAEQRIQENMKRLNAK